MKKNSRLIIAATQSGSGKTTIVTGIIAALRSRGLKVQPYKIGPDYIDPGYHSIAANCPCHNLDSWLMPKDKLQEIFVTTSDGADIAIIEGVMGLYDGGTLSGNASLLRPATRYNEDSWQSQLKNGISSTAEIAKLLKAPVILVIDVKSMGASAAAIALGFREYDREVDLRGVILNRVGSENHRVMIEEALEKIGIKCFGAIKRDKNLITPERHLGLLPTAENETSALIENIRVAINSQVDIDSLIEVANLSPTQPLYKAAAFDLTSAETATATNLTLLKSAISTNPTSSQTSTSFNSQINSEFRLPPSALNIAVAKDEAFNFYYPESLKVLESFGAEIVYFSPLHDKHLPEVNGLIIGGGFPEMFTAQLEANETMRNSIQVAASNGLPIFAECGGYMYLMNELIDFNGKSFNMVGAIDNTAKMNERLQMVGYVEAALMSDCILGKCGDIFHAHEFHFSNEIKSNRQNIFSCVRMRNNQKYSAGFFSKNIVASYLHIHFVGCIEAAKNFVESCRIYQRGENHG